ncbi:MAG: glycosyltransferase family 39 protein [Prosthecobacter sp.]
MSSESQPTRRIELLLFVGTLLLYILNVIATDHRDFIWDEGRYHKYAEHLTQGFYVTPEKPDIINGPGYPLVLAPMIVAGVSVMGQRMLNALFIAFAVWFSFRAVLPYAGRRWALIVALVTALHPSLVRAGPFLMTEALAVCCVAGFGWAFSAALRAEKWRWSLILAAGFAFGWLTLTRVFFGNVIMAAVVFLVLLLIVWESQRGKLLRALAMMAVAFTMCVPWLAYTHSITGEKLCWSTVSGELLYWMTSTQPGENGHWFSVEEAQYKPELVAHHRELFLTYYEVSVKEREATFKRIAMEQLRANPLGVYKNWLSNLCRLVFGFPRSFQTENFLNVGLVVFNGPILLIALIALYYGLKKCRSLPIEVLLLALLLFIYLGGSTLAPGQPRYSTVIWPWLGMGIATVLSRSLRVSVVRD